MFASTDPKQPFYVANKVEVNSEQEKVLTHLYQPLVGTLGIGLYITLMNEFDSIPFAGDYKTLYQLQDQTTSNLKSIFDSLHHLEATGLVKTFIGNNPVLGDVIIFKLQVVPTAQEFFRTFLLSSLLLERVGLSTYKRLVSDFTPQKFAALRDAKEVTSGFFDVFHLSANKAIEPDEEVKKAHQQVGSKQPRTLKLGKNPIRVDWEFMTSLFEAYHIDKEEIEHHRSEIIQIMNFYHLDEQDFVNTAVTTLTAGSSKLDMRAIQDVANSNFGQNRNRQLVREQLKSADTKDNEIVANLSKQENELLKKITEKAPIDYLYDIKQEKGGYVTYQEKRIIYRLENNTGLTAEIVNILIYYCLQYDTVLSSNLADKIANDWLQNDINTPQKAIQYVHNRAAKKEKQKKRYTARKVGKRETSTSQGTNWDKYRKHKAATPPSSQEMSKEEMNRIFNEFSSKSDN